MISPTASVTVLTAVTPNMWDEYVLFSQSLAQSPTEVRLEVIASGLSRNLMAWLSSQQISVIAVCQYMFPRWAKADWILRAVYSRPPYLIWLDVDTIVRDLDGLIDKAKNQFTVFRDAVAPMSAANDPQLYEQYDLQPPTRVLNSGVIALQPTRDFDCIKLWAGVSTEIGHKLNPLVAFEDQGALLLAMHQLGMTHLIDDDISWNFPARRRIYPARCSLMEEALKDHPEAHVIHYAGAQKLSELSEFKQGGDRRI